MALARVKTWVPGEILTAADLNGEFNNILNNPISLISPLTANVNANGKQITNLALESLGASPSPGVVGRIWFNSATSVKQVETDDGAFIRTVPSILATSLSPGDLIYAIAATSSAGNNPSWTRLSNPSIPAFAATSSGNVGQVLVSGTSGPLWSGKGSGIASGVASAWVCFTGNTTSSQAAVLAAFNVTTSIDTIIKNSSGDWTIPWINQFTTVNYPVLAICSETTLGGATQLIPSMTTSGNSTSAARIQTKDISNLLQNPVFVHVVAFGPVV